jgi:peptide/nickel transport system permease protein
MMITRKAPSKSGSSVAEYRSQLKWRYWLRHPAARLAVRRLALAVPQLLVVSAVSFLLVSLTPGNAALSILGPNATSGSVATLRREFRLNLPLWDQYWQWLRHAAAGDLGISFSTGQPVGEAIGQRLPVTLSLLVGALLVSLIVGVWIGVVSALRGGVIGRTVDALALIGFALPGFWVGAELIVIFAVKFRWLPATGFVPLSQSPSQWLRSLVLPVAALSLTSVAAVAKQTREAMLETLGMEYVRMARASGLSPKSIIFRHALKNASIRIVTILGVQAVGLLAGTIFVENVFALPGLGSAVSSAALSHDLPLVQAIAVVFTIMVVLINLAIDLTYMWLNPKVRVQ